MDTPFEFLQNCFLKKELITSNSAVPDFYFPVIRMLSFHKKLLATMAKISSYQSRIPSWALGCLLYNVTPKSSFIPKSGKYISAKSSLEEDSPELETIKKVYCLNTKHGKQVLEILKQQKVNFGEKGRKKVKKIPKGANKCST